MTADAEPPADNGDSEPDTVPTDAGEPGDPATSTGAIERSRSATPAAIDPARLPVASIPSAAPTRGARGLAFVAIIVGGLCGGLIGFAFTDLQCTDGCTTAAGIGGIVGALIGAAGVAVVAVLALRAMDEWETIKARGDKVPPRRRSRS